MIRAFYSDPHFGHYNIIKSCNRPFESLDEMHETLINNYNSLIDQHHTVIWLGDAFFKGSVDYDQQIMDSLNGYKIILQGNHDRSATFLAKIGFSLVLKDFPVIKIGNRVCRLSHYPYANINHVEGVDIRDLNKRPKHQPGEVLIHGHTHSSRKRENNCIHVGVDAWDFKPVLWEEVEKLVNLI